MLSCSRDELNPVTLPWTLSPPPSPHSVLPRLAAEHSPGVWNLPPPVRVFSRSCPSLPSPSLPRLLKPCPLPGSSSCFCLNEAPSIPPAAGLCPPLDSRRSGPALHFCLTAPRMTGLWVLALCPGQLISRAVPDWGLIPRCLAENRHSIQ